MSGRGGDGPPKKRACPMCGRPAVHAFRPFCSRRCADIDLGRWMTGAYAVPAFEDPDGFYEGGAAGRDDEEDRGPVH